MANSPKELLEELRKYLDRRISGGDRRITKIDLRGDTFIFTHVHEGVTREVPVGMNDAQAILSGFETASTGVTPK